MNRCLPLPGQCVCKQCGRIPSTCAAFAVPPQELTNEWEAAGIIEDAGHSSVSLAKQADGKLLAVKRAKKVSKEGGHMFRNEVRTVHSHERLPCAPLLRWPRHFL